MSEVKEVVIRSESDALGIIEKAMAGQLSDDDSFLIKFDGWPIFDLDIEGDKYHSTVTTPMMKGLLEYQQVINRIFADNIYSKGARALTEEDRANLELTFKVAEGSSDIQAQLGAAFNKFGEKMIDKMTGRQLVITVVGLALIAACYFGHQTYTSSQLALLQENNKSALEMRLIESNDKMSKALADTNQAIVGIVKSAPDATKVTAGNTVFDRADILQISQKEREATVLARMDGKYNIYSLRSFDDKWRMDIAPVGSDDSVKVDLYKGQHAAAAINEIMVALVEGQPVFLYVLARSKDGKVVSANVMGTSSTGLPTPSQNDQQNP